MISPARMSPRIGCSANSNPVTTPKLPPPPRIAQKRSGFSVALARSRLPSAVTTSADRRLSSVMPYFRVSQPNPPPSVSPAIPVVELMPVGRTRPLAAVSLSTSPSVAPGSTQAVLAAASTRTDFISDRSSRTAPSATEWPAIWCPPLRIEIRSPFSRAKLTAAQTSAAPRARTTSPGLRSTIAFQTVRASSYPASPFRATVPRIPARSAPTASSETATGFNSRLRICTVMAFPPVDCQALPVETPLKPIPDRALFSKGFPWCFALPRAERPFSPPDDQPVEPVEVKKVGVAGRFREAEAGKAREEDRQRGREFQPGERSADAEVKPRTEGEVGFDRTARVEAGRPVPLRRVAVCRGEKAGDLVAAAEAVARYLDLLVGPAGEEMERRVEAQDFLDRPLDPFGRQRIGAVAALDQRLHAVAEGVDRRLVTRIEEEDAGGDQFVGGEPLALHLGRDEVGDEVVGGARAAFVHVAAQEGDEGFRGRDGGLLGRAAAAGLVHPDHRVRPGEKVRAAFLGHAEEPGNDDHRQALGEGRQQVERALRKGVDQVMREGRDLGRQRGDPARGEGAEHQ